MRLETAFETKNLPQADSFDPIPAGWYGATVEKAEVKETKSGTGRYLNIQWKVDGPKYAGRIIFDMINYNNSNPKAQEIGLRQLSSLLAATAIFRLEDTDQLIGASCQIKVSIREQDGYDPQNVIKTYKAHEGSSLPKPAPAEAPQEKRAPWQR
jgi:hypothetical protein